MSRIRIGIGVKLRPPAIPDDHVPRTALTARFLASPGTRLTVVRAPSGFGKTLFMAECRAALEALGRPTAWLTLDAGDDDSFRLVRSLDAALAGLGLRSPPSAEESWFALLDRVGASAEPFSLFIDDFERLTDEASPRLVRELIEALPPGARVVIGSRTPPDLGLGRLRAQGLAQEFEAADLRFDDRETAEFLGRRRGLRLSEEDLSRLHRKTEGWPAALRLAGLALEREGAAGVFVARFSGSDRMVAEYLAEEVLERQPPDRVSFLLRTSILDRLEPELCDALHPPGGSAAMLAGMAAANVLLTPAEGAAGPFRYHSLFADFLRGQLVRRMPGERARLHAAASRWLAARGRPVPAIDHALHAGDFEGAIDLLDRHGREVLEQGRLRLLTRWFEAMPAEALAGRPQLQLVRAWATCFTRGPAAAGAQLDAAGLEASKDAEVRAEARAVRIMLLSMSDAFEAAYPLGREALEGPPLRSAYAASALGNSLATLFTGVGAFDEARESLSRARREAGGFNAMHADGTEGIIDLLEGRIRDAGARFRLALAASREDPRGRNGNNAWAVLLHATALYEANDLRRAGHLIRLHLPMARDLGLIDHVILGYVMLSRIAAEEGDPDGSAGLLDELEHLARRRRLPRAEASARLERARSLMSRGHLDAAREQIARADDPAVWQVARRLRLRANDVEYPVVARIRLALHEERAAAALADLRRELAEAASSGRLRRALALRLLEGAARRLAGDVEGACAVLDLALSDAAREGAVRLVLDEGALLAPSIRAAVQRGVPQAQRRDPHMRAWLQDLLAAMPRPERAGAAEETLATPLEPLTAKEMEVLGLLAEGCSNQMISDRLGVSDSTVRTHLRSLNSKLDARSRAQAVAVARRMGLIW